MPLTFGNGNMCGRVGVAQQKPHGRTINRNAAQSGAEIVFLQMQKNRTARALFGRCIIHAQFEKHVI